MKTNTCLLCVAVLLSVLAPGCWGSEHFEEPPAVDGGGVDGGGPLADGGVDGGDDAGSDAGSDSEADAGIFAPLRIMAANLTSGPAQSYDPGHGIRLMRGVDPDVILIQEFNYGLNREEDIRQMVDQVGPGFDYYREKDASIPNGIISRWPILDAGEWTDAETFTRDFAWARIDIPGPRDLWAVSVHLLTEDSEVRRAQAAEIVEKVEAVVPAGDYLVIGGDLNTDTRSEPAFGVLERVVVTAGPYPADKNRNANTNSSRRKPYDHVLVDPDLHALRKATVIGFTSFEAGLVLDTRVYAPLSEIAPAQADDSSASDMQHMGVVRDFRIPVP